MKAMLLLTSLILSLAVWAESMPADRDTTDRTIVWVDELKSLKDKDAVIQSRLDQAAQKLDKIKMDLTPRYFKLFEAAQKEFAQLRNEANLNKYVPMMTWENKSLQEYVLKHWNRFQAERPDSSYAQNQLLRIVSEHVETVRSKQLRGIDEKRAKMLVEKMGEANDVYSVALYVEFSIHEAKDKGTMMWLGSAQEKAKRIGYPLPPDLIQDIQVVGARTSTYLGISTLVLDHNKRTLRDHQADLKEIRSQARMGGLDVSQALAKIENCMTRQIACQVQASDIMDADAKMRAATEKIDWESRRQLENF